MARSRKPRRDPIKKAKPVNISLLQRENAGRVTKPYSLVDKLVAERHAHLTDAKIAVAWDMKPPKEDADGRVLLGRVKKGSDLDRELSPYDFVIVIPHGVWNVASFTEHHMEALIDSLLCRFAIVTDKQGDPKLDDKGRQVYRLRKPIACFPENLSKYGLWHSDFERLGKATLAFNDSKRPLLKDGEHANGNGKATKANRFSDPALPTGGAASN